MEGNNFFLDLIASLKKNESKKQIQSDIKEIGDIKIPLTGTLSKSKTRKQIKEDVKNLGDINASLVGKLNKSKTKAQIKKDLESTNSTVNLTGKVDSKNITTSVKQATVQSQKAANSNPVDIDVAFKVKKEKLLNDIKLLAQQNSKLFKNTDMSIKYNTLLDNAEIARNTVELSTLRTQLGSLRSELKVTGNAGMTMTDTLKSGLSKILQLFGGHGIITQFTVQLRNAWTEAKELDSAMTDLSRVNSEITRSGFPGYLDKVISKTKELSVATKDYIDAVTTFSRAGYNLADSEILASAAVQLEKVGDMTAEAASKSLLSGLQAYGEIDGYGMDQLAEKAQALNDKIDLIGNTASISQAEVASGIQAVGSVMSDANTSVDEFLSLLAAGNRSVQDSNKVALAIRTSALRIRGCTSELEEMGETTDDVIESTSTLAAKIKALTNIDGNGGVNILEADEETFRSIYDIYNDIAKVYDKMSDVDASSLLDLIAGKNRSNQVSAILQNMSEANELLEKSLNAAGTATAEYEIYLDSAQAASERFGVAMTETYNNILNGETVKGLTNAGSAVLEFANSWNIVEGTLKGFLALGVLKGITTLTVAFKNSAVQVSNYGTALNEVKKVSTFAEDTRDYADAMKNLKISCTNLKDAQLKQVLANRNLEKSQLIEILQLKTLKEEEQEARLAQLGLIQTTNQQTVANGAAAASTFSLKSAMTGLWASIKSAVMSNPVGIAIMGISAIIGVVTSQISKYNQKIEEARQKAKELADAYRQQQSSLDSQIKKYKELKESLDSGNLSTDEARSVKEQLLDIQNSLVDSYGNEVSSIDLLNGKYREQLGLLGELSKEKAEDFIVENRDVYDDAKKQLEKERTFDLGTVTSWSNYAPKTQDQQNLIDYIEAYSKFLELTYKGGGGTTAVNVSVKADVQNADKVMRQFAKDLEEYGATNGIDVSNILDQIPEQLRSAWTDELKEYKTVYDEFIKAEVIRSDTLRPLYHESIKAVEEYNNALSSGEGVSEAKANLDSVQQSVQSVTGQLEGSQDIFDGIYEGINRCAEAAYNLSQAFETDETVKKYAEQLRGLTDIDLKAINFEDSVQSPGEEAFGALIEILGLSEDEVQKLIDKLVELGYVQGEVKNSAPNIEPLNFSEGLLSSEESMDRFQSSVKSAAEAYTTLLTGNYSSSELLDSIRTITQAASDMGQSIDWESISASDNPLQELQDAIESVSKAYAESILNGTGIDTDSKFGKMLANIIQNAYESEAALSSLNTQMDSLQDAYDSLTDIVDTYNETGYITFDQLQNLLAVEPQYLSCLIDENGQLQLNQEAMLALASQRLNDAEAQAVQQAITELGQLTLQDEKTAVDENAQAFSNAVNDLAAYNSKLSETISEASVAASVIRDLNAAISGAESGGAADVQIDTVLNNLNTKLKLIKNTRGGLSKGFDNIVGGKSSSSSKSSKETPKESKETAESFNWIEKAVSRVQRTIKNLGDTVSSTWRNWKDRNDALASQLNEVRKEISLQQSAYESYMRAAESVGLSDHYKSLVQNGALSIESIADDTLKEQIKLYQEWYEKALDCSDAVQELKGQLAELAKTKFNNIEKQFDNAIGMTASGIASLEKQISIAEESGKIAGEAFYEAMAEYSTINLEALEKKHASLSASLQEALNNGSIEEYSDDWFEMTEAINSVDEAILDTRLSLIKYEESMKQVAKLKFDAIGENFDKVTDYISCELPEKGDAQCHCGKMRNSRKP